VVGVEDGVVVPAAVAADGQPVDAHAVEAGQGLWLPSSPYLAASSTRRGYTSPGGAFGA
jgi:hypothetical protein